MMQPDELSLDSIDSMRHLIVNPLIVKAVTFAVRNTGREVHTYRDDRTAYRFVTALVMTNTLEDGRQWPEVLETVTHLESEEES